MRETGSAVPQHLLPSCLPFVGPPVSVMCVGLPLRRRCQPGFQHAAGRTCQQRSSLPRAAPRQRQLLPWPSQLFLYAAHAAATWHTCTQLPSCIPCTACVLQTSVACASFGGYSPAPGHIQCQPASWLAWLCGLEVCPSATELATPGMPCRSRRSRWRCCTATTTAGKPSEGVQTEGCALCVVQCDAGALGGVQTPDRGSLICLGQGDAGGGRAPHPPARRAHPRLLTGPSRQRLLELPLWTAAEGGCPASAGSGLQGGPPPCRLLAPQSAHRAATEHVPPGPADLPSAHQDAAGQGLGRRVDSTRGHHRCVQSVGSAAQQQRHSRGAAEAQQRHSSAGARSRARCGAKARGAGLLLLSCLALPCLA